jgi:predicted PurR-regulated permease PerM
MSQTPSNPPPAPTKKRPGFLEWLPWEKVTIWGLFLLAVYVLRHFFFIIFLTFILAYIMRGIIQRITGVLTPSRRETPWLERSLAVVLFALLLFGLYNLGDYFGPRLIDQGEALFGRITRGIQGREFDDLKTKIAGPILFRMEYPTESTGTFQADFDAFREAKGGPTFSTKFNQFGSLLQELDASFLDRFREREKRRLEADLEGSRLSETAFERWYRDEIATVELEQNRERYEAEWEAAYVRLASRESLEAFRAEPGSDKIIDERIKETILETHRRSDPDGLGILRNRFRKETLEAALQERLAEIGSDDEFRAHFEARKAESPGRIPYDWDQFSMLRKAHAQGDVAFAAAMKELQPLSEEELLEQARKDFIQERQKLLADDWWSHNPFGLQIQRSLDEAIKGGIKQLGELVRQLIGFLISFPFQLGLSLLLSFFITFDVPKIRRGLRQLKKSRVSEFYDEIAPGLASFARLIGRAFQAQGVIALFNTLLTFIGIKLLGVQNEVFLCAIVFGCSFIPVLGVVISSVPIAVMALVQDGGSIFLSLQILGVIIAIHFIETTVLNPKILGDMLHMHPVLVLTVLAIGEHFFGVWGLLLAVPVAVYIIRIVILNQGVPGVVEAAGVIANDGEPPTDVEPPAAPGRTGKGTPVRG